jgi:hypothetical protein
LITGNLEAQRHSILCCSTLHEAIWPSRARSRSVYGRRLLDLLTAMSRSRKESEEVCGFKFDVVIILLGDTDVCRPQLRTLG